MKLTQGELYSILERIHTLSVYVDIQKLKDIVLRKNNSEQKKDY